jgi:hypothetical protein
VRGWSGSLLTDLTKRQLKVRALEGYLHARNVLRFGPSVHGGRGIIVSMTTHPGRIGSVHLALESILRGRLRPAALCLWLAEEELSEADLTAELKRLRDRGVTIEFVRPNFRPGNKLVHALERFPDRTIVVADDDVLYPKNWLVDLVRASRESPDAIICHRAHYLNVSEDGSLAPYVESKDSGVGGRHPSFRLLATGVSGVLYPPGSLDDRVCDHDVYASLCPTADDIWFKAMSLLTGTRTRRVRDHDLHFETVSGSQRQSLMELNIAAGRNDQALKSVFAHFGLNDVLATD